MGYSTAVKTARMTATRDALADGTLEILTAADAVLVALPLTAQGGTISGAVWTLAFDGPADATGTGVAAKAQLKTSGGVVGRDGMTCGLSGSGADVILQNTNIATGQTVSVTAATITHSTED